MKRGTILLLSLLPIASLSNWASAGWKQAAQIDMYRVVIVDASDVRTTKVYWDALNAVCGSDSYCNVIFFSADDARIKTVTSKLSDEDRARALLIYNRSKGFTWNCKLRPDADNCFRR